MGFRNIYSTQVGLVINPLTFSMPPHYHVVFDDMFSIVMISTSVYP